MSVVPQRSAGSPSPAACLPRAAGEGRIFPGRVLAIDPGLRRCGAAIFEGGLLVGAALVRGVADTTVRNGSVWCAMAREVALFALAGGHQFTRIMIEFPRIHRAAARGTAMGADPNDLLQLAATIGAIEATVRHKVACGLVETCLPGEWKGTIPKAMVWERVLNHLSVEEQARVMWPAASLREHVIEAIGIGLWTTGRAGRAMVRI